MTPAYGSLTDRQLEVLAFIDQSRFRPTFLEIMRRFNFRSKNGVTCHIHALLQKGMIGHDTKLARALTITPAGRDYLAHRQVIQVVRTLIRTGIRPRLHHIARLAPAGLDLRAITDHLVETDHLGIDPDDHLAFTLPGETLGVIPQAELWGAA